VTAREVLLRSASWLRQRGFESARLEAELLLAHVLGVDRVTLYVHADRPLDDAELEGCRALLRRRGEGEPVAYLTGRREFYGLELKVNRAVLVPRPETELLVDRAREIAPRRLLDVGTGSGCIAVACAVRMPGAAVTATEVSAAALEVARENAARHGVADRIRFLQGDLFAPVPGDERFDLIASNPPYVAEGQARDVARHEPREALYAGPEGLDVIARLLDGAPSRLAPTGTLLVEIGEDQAAAALDLARARFERVEVRRDLAGLPRVLEASAPLAGPGAGRSPQDPPS
jgi:release factor glutamine methyltransferase